jgi:hypothetical protein
VQSRLGGTVPQDGPPSRPVPAIVVWSAPFFRPREIRSVVIPPSGTLARLPQGVSVSPA